QVHLVARGAGQDEFRVGDPGPQQRLAPGAAAVGDAHVVGVREGVQARPVDVDHRAVVCLGERLDDGVPDLPRTHDDDPHTGIVARTRARCGDRLARCPGRSPCGGAGPGTDGAAGRVRLTGRARLRVW